MDEESRRTDPQAPDRRRFLHSAAAIGLAAVAGARLDPALSPARKRDTEAEPAGALNVQDEFELSEATIDQMQAWMKAGRYSSRSLVEAYLTRISAVDDAGPVLNSIIEKNPDALRIADSLDAERKEKGPRGPLHGIPVLLKDIFDTADQMKTTAGSFALANSTPRRDAFVVERLRAAGAVLIGKTNLSEWSAARSTNGTSGWSARGGLTKNPYALDRNACGSSSGTAVAVSANLGAVGIGAETTGSIACPASANGLVGVKPTVGLLSRAGVIPVTYSFDSPGPMTRTVRDAAIMLGAMTGVDFRDLATDASNGNAHTDYTRFLDAGGLKGARLGVLRGNFHPHTEVSKVVEQALAAIKAAGATLVDPVGFSTLRRLELPQATVLLCELKDLIAEYLRTRGTEEPHKTLGDLIRFNQENADTELKYFGQEWFELSQMTDGRRSPEYHQDLLLCRQLTQAQGIDGLLQEFRLDALVALTSGPAFYTDLANGDYKTDMLTTVASTAGYPHVTVPAGFVFRLPIGISFIGTAWSEPLLLRLAYAFEQATRFRRAPTFLPTVTIDR